MHEYAQEFVEVTLVGRFRYHENGSTSEIGNCAVNSDRRQPSRVDLSLNRSLVAHPSLLRVSRLPQVHTRLIHVDDWSMVLDESTQGASKLDSLSVNGLMLSQCTLVSIFCSLEFDAVSSVESQEQRLTHLETVFGLYDLQPVVQRQESPLVQTVLDRVNDLVGNIATGPAGTSLLNWSVAVSMEGVDYAINSVVMDSEHSSYGTPTLYRPAEVGQGAVSQRHHEESGRRRV